MKNNVKIQDDTQSLQSCVSVSVTDKDFRIGNLINYRIVDKMDERQEWLEVSEIDYDDLRIFGIKDKMNNDYQPIPLTEYWIKKLGFFCYGKKRNWFDIDISKGYEMSINTDGKISIGQNGNWTSLNFINKIEYVHQLQNIYHALTGSDLQIGNLTEH